MGVGPRTRSGLALALLAATSACRYPATAILARVSTDMSWGPGQALTTLELRVWSGAVLSSASQPAPLLLRTLELGQGPGQQALPGTFTLAPNGPLPARVTVELTARRGATVLFSNRAIASYASRETLLLDLFLADRCRTIALTCDPSQTCGRTGCEAIERPFLPRIDPRDAGSLVDVSAADASDEPAPTDASEAALAAQDAAAEPAPEASVDAPEAGLDAALDESATADASDASLVEAGPPPPPPRLLAPASQSVVTSNTPTMRWALQPRSVGSVLEFCPSRDCASGVVSVPVPASGSVGTSGPASALAPGVWFWRVRAVPGPGDPAQASAVWQLVVPRRSRAGSVVGALRDVDGDGLADAVVGDATGTPGQGRAYVFHGSRTGLGLAPVETLSAMADGEAFGDFHTTALGDIDGDGFGDVLVGAPGAAMNAGRVYLFRGGPAGVTTTPSVLEGAAGDCFGRSVEVVGDVNDDGFNDVLVGASCNDGTGANEARLYFGSASGLPAVPSLVLRRPASTPGAFGSAVAALGDSNGDGLSDFAVAAFGHPTAGSAGAVHVYLGGSGALSATPATTVSNPAGATRFAPDLESGLDVNGDGFGDLAVTDYATGRLFVHHGGSSGIPATPSTTYTSTTSGDRLGLSLGPGGDVNNDGFSDLVAGGNGGSGVVYLFLGSAGGLAGPVSALPSPDGAGVGWGGDVAIVGDADGDGFAELLASAAGHVPGHVYLYRGTATGVDVAPSLLLTPASDTLSGFGTSLAARALSRPRRRLALLR